jgi:hypothetical protein
MPHNGFCGRTRREFLWEAGGGFTALALSALLAKDSFLSSQAVAADGVSRFVNPLAPKEPYHPARARSVIFLYMYGGPSHIDTFDFKPKMKDMEGKTVAVKTFGRGGAKDQGRIVEPRWAFRPYGKCGKRVSDLFPHVGRCVDDIAFLLSMTADSGTHGSAMLQMNTGTILSGSPSLGSWVNYGLGSENENLPGFVVMLDPRGGPISGPKNWSSGYMPAPFEGITIRATGAPILDLKPPAPLSEGVQRAMLDTLRECNDEHLARCGDNPALAARIASYELAFRMQSAAPEAVDLRQEATHTQELYGLNEKSTEVFGRQCLLARRFVERGVRFIQIYSGGNQGMITNWDAHDDLVGNHAPLAAEIDRPIAGLLTDLKQRGLLDSTLVVWGGEFGRQPINESATGVGRDHNAYGFTMWLAGGGVKGGISVGATDDLGSAAVEKPFHVRNLHATILHLLGLDPNGLTYFHGGREQKLVGVDEAEPIREML